MTTTATESMPGDNDSPSHPGEHHSHGPTDRFYFGVFWALFALTALEVSTYFWESWFGENAHKVAVPLLLILMVIKFVMVAMFFMHLKFDAPMLKRIFYFGLVVALVVYMIAMTSMNIWTDNGNPWYDDPPPAVQPTTTIAGG